MGLVSAWPAGEKMLAELRVVCRGAIECAARSLSDRGRSTRRSQLAAPTVSWARRDTLQCCGSPNRVCTCNKLDLRVRSWSDRAEDRSWFRPGACA